MIGLAEIARSIYGGWRLARGDAGGLDWFTLSAGGVWRSFWGPVLVLPGVLLVQGLDGAFDAGPLRPLVTQIIAFVIGCTAFPLLVAQISEEIGRGPLFCRYLVAYNWSAVIQLAALLPVALLAWAVPGPLPSLLNLVVTIALLFYQTYVARVALAVNGLTASLLVVLDLLLGTLIQGVADRIGG